MHSTINLSSQAYAIRGEILYFTRDPSVEKNSYIHYRDGILIVDQGKIVSCDSATEMLPHIQNYQLELQHYSHHLILPGFVDTHIHYPQYHVMASYGEQLLTWLNKYVFPEEERFSDYTYAENIAHLFCKQLVRGGTTTALVFATAHDVSVNALFKVAKEFNLCVISGKVLNDQYIPKSLADEASQAYDISQMLIEKWHGQERFYYAIMPRFAPLISSALWKTIKKLSEQYPEIYIHTHLSETQEEVAWVKKLYPHVKNYLEVYNQYGLVRANSIFAHSIHLNTKEWQMLADAHSAIAFCPSSNLFLGSGVFNWHQACKHHIKIGIGTDIGAGTSFSLLKTLSDAYKVLQFQGQNLSALQGFYQITLGGAQALNLDHRVGHFKSGADADVVILDLAADSLIHERLSRMRTLEEKLFVLMILGDERLVKDIYIKGRKIVLDPV